ncbi:hypothetical protein F9K94_15515 [Brucella tritici]|uniref:DUF551 domain-containing protein n=1 Tax=Brucella tritici TaxID=94626 RepID=A0A7V8B1J5_9HYPH|nr:hypothetical protein [Brucella tritici]KAB2655933.1 hypothetical protein F9K94_15515 [Brucella tritici]
MTSTTVPEEAVNAAINAWFEETRPHVMNATPLPEQARRMRLALSAAIPFMMDAPCGYRLIPQQPTQTMLEVMAFNLSAEFGADFTRENQEFALAVYNEAWALGVRPLPHLPQGEPSAARKLALEEAAKIADELEERTKLKYASPDGEECQIVPLVLLIEASAAIRALSSPDHADAGKVEGDGWLPIESAPKDGTEIIYLTKYGSIGFCRYAVDDINDWFGWWDLQADDEVYPKRWLPRSTLPSAPSHEVAGS